MPPCPRCAGSCAAQNRDLSAIRQAGPLGGVLDYRSMGPELFEPGERKVVGHCSDSNADQLKLATLQARTPSAAGSVRTRRCTQAWASLSVSD
jgi:hypothetical protein